MHEKSHVTECRHGPNHKGLIEMIKNCAMINQGMLETILLLQ